MHARPKPRKPATDRRWADHLSRSVDAAAGWPTYHAIRLVYRLRWFRTGTSSVTGTAEHFARCRTSVDL